MIIWVLSPVVIIEMMLDSMKKGCSTAVYAIQIEWVAQESRVVCVNSQKCK